MNKLLINNNTGTNEATNEWISKKDVAKSFGVSMDTLERAVEELSCRSTAATQNHIKKEEIMNSLSNVEDKYIYTKKDLCDSFKVDTRTFENFASEIDFGSKIKNLGGHRNVKFYTQEVADTFGLWLKKNAMSQGKQSEVIKQSNYEDIEVGMAANAVMASGSVEAAEEFAKLLIAKTQAVAELKLEKERNRQLKEDNNRKDKVIDRLLGEYTDEVYDRAYRDGRKALRWSYGYDSY